MCWAAVPSFCRRAATWRSTIRSSPLKSRLHTFWIRVSRADRPPLLPEQDLQDLKLLGPQVDGLSIHGDLPQGGVQKDAAIGQLPRPQRLSRAAPENGLGFGHQDREGEGLGDIVVRACAEARQGVFLLAQGGDEQNGDRAVLPHLAAHLQTGEVGHHHVQNEQVKGLLRHGGQGLFPVGDRQDLQPCRMEKVQDQGGQSPVILRQQNIGCHWTHLLFWIYHSRTLSKNHPCHNILPGTFLPG